MIMSHNDQSAVKTLSDKVTRATSITINRNMYQISAIDQNKIKLHNRFLWLSIGHKRR